MCFHTLKPAQPRTILKLTDMPVELLHNITHQLPFVHRRLLAATQFEFATAVFEALALEAAYNQQAAKEIEQQALQAADPVTGTEQRAIGEIMEDAITAILRLRREEFQSSAALQDPSPLVLLAQRVVCVVLETDVKKCSERASASLDMRVREAYKELLVSQLDSCVGLGSQLATLDIVRLGACQSGEIHELMKRFTEIVAQDDLVIENPVAEWAVVICLWLRRVSQVCAALDCSMHTSYAQSVLKQANILLTTAKLRHHRWEHEVVKREARLCMADHKLTLTDDHPTIESKEFVEDFVATSDEPRSEDPKSVGFITSFLRSGHGSPVLADHTPRMTVRACNRLRSGDFLMPQVG